MSDGIVIALSVVAIGVCAATVLHLRCVEKRMNAEYERQARAALQRLHGGTPK